MRGWLELSRSGPSDASHLKRCPAPDAPRPPTPAGLGPRASQSRAGPEMNGTFGVGKIHRGSLKPLSVELNPLGY